jgi:heptosyltransferase-2
MPDRVLVVAPNWLGDAVMALPAIADVRQQYASARLLVAARASVAPLFAMVPGVDEVLTLRGSGALHRAARIVDVEVVRAARPDVAILLPNSFAAAWLTTRAGVRERWGYARDVRRFLLTRAVQRPSRSVHQGAYYQHLVRELGIANGPLEPIVEVPAAATDAARRLLFDCGVPDGSPIVVIAPGAAYGTAKRWLPTHFAALVAGLAEAHRVHSVLVGSAGDADTTTLIADALPMAVRDHLIDLTGRTSLAELAGLLRLARVCVSNDSGAMHVAGAVGTPVAAIFGPTREHETAPLMRAHAARRVFVNPVWCRPCMLRECPIDHRCMRGLAPGHVQAGVAELLASSAARDAGGESGART